MVDNDHISKCARGVKIYLLRSQRKVIYQQQKRYNTTAMDRFSDFKVGMASQLMRKRSSVARAASDCNVFVVATFSSLNMMFN